MSSWFRNVEDTVPSVMLKATLCAASYSFGLISALHRTGRHMLIYMAGVGLDGTVP